MDFKLAYHYFIKTKKIKTAYHEADHCVIAALFQDKLILKCLTINESEVKKINSNWRGGLNFELNNKLSSTDYELQDKLVLIALAGVCAKTIYIEGNAFVNKNLHNFKYNTKLLSLKGATDDYNLATPLITQISQAYQIEHTYVTWSAFRFVFELFLTSVVWQSIKCIAEELIKHKNKTLLATEINQILNDCGLINFIKISQSKIMMNRYPLCKDSLIRI